MKIKNLIPLALLFGILLTNTAFVNSNNTNTKEVDPSFIAFLSLFEKVTLPFEIELDDFEKYQNQKEVKKVVKKKRDISQDKNRQLMNDYLNETMFISRMGPPQLMPVARFYPDDQTIAVIYMPYRAFGRSDDLVFNLAFFDLEGKRIFDKQDENAIIKKSFTLASSFFFEQAQTFCIYPNKDIVQKTYKTIWKNDIKKTGIKHNEIKDYVLEKTVTYKIGKNGKVLLDELANATDRAMID